MPAPSRISSRWVPYAGATALAAIFALDLALPPSVAAGICYVGPILLGLWAPRSRYALACAAAATVLVTVDIAVQAGSPDPAASLNHLFSVVAIWTVALVTWWYLELRSAAATSRKALSDYKAALDQSAIVAVTDRRGLITYANDKFCEISKYSREELLGRDHRLLNSGLHSKEFIRDLWETIGRGEVWRGEIRNRAKDGTLYWVDTVIVPFLDETGRPFQHVAIRTDITERKRAEAQLLEQQALARLGSMAAVVAHEVKNPLAGIAGALQILQRRMPADSPDRPVVGEMLGRLGALDGMVQDLLLFARPREPRAADVDLGALVRESAALLRADPAMSALEIEVDGECGVVRGDPDMLRQAFTNLLLNAAHATHAQGRVRIDLSRDRTGVVVAVQDDGPGVAAEARDRIFEPFFTTKSRGTGLGLPLARRHVERLGGTLVLADAPRGARFEVRLPSEPPGK